nr:hypothetical protein [Tanacetum cinerariifolium]
MYAEVFGIDVPLTQSQSTESTQGPHRTPSAPRSPNPKVDAAKLSAPTRSIVIRLRLPQQKSIRLTPPAQVLMVDKADELILQDTVQVSLAKHKSRQEQEAIENVALVEKHLASKEIEKMVEGQKHVVDDSSIPRNDKHNIPDTRLEPRSDKESPEVGITDVIVHVNVYDEEDKRTDELPRKSCITLTDHLHKAMADSLPTMVDKLIKEQVQQQVPEQDDPHDDAHLEGEKGVKRQKTSEYEAYVSGESSSGLDNEQEQGPLTSVSQDIMEEVSLNVDEAKLKKIADEMLRQRCTSGDEHQYHIDQMKNFLKSDIVWESRKEILVSPHPRKTTPLVLSCQRDPEAPALSLINQDLLYLKKGNSGPEKIVLSLHKKQKEPGKPKEVIYSNSKIVQVIKTYWELGHEHKFITKIIERRANDCIVSITEPDFKNLNKNNIEDMYLLIMNGKKVNLIAPTISFLGIEEYEMFSIIYEPVHGIIYKNSKKEKMVMRHSEIHKFCDATLNKVLKGLKSYNNDVKYGYNQRDLTKDEVGYLKLFEEEIKDRLKYRRQMRRWESYVNERPLGLRRERLE